MAILNYVLQRADTNLILGQRLSEWCGHGPVLEQDIALTNIALDLVGQARAYYSYAAELADDGRTEDDFAYLRTEREFLNPLLCEVDNGDWGQTVLRQFLFDSFHYLLLTELKGSGDEHLAALAAKGFKEVTYHLRYSRDWVIRLGDGTEESNRRMQRALDTLWLFTGELTTASPTEEAAHAEGLAPLPEVLAGAYRANVREVLAEARLRVPDLPADAMRLGGKNGIHSEQLGFILAEMQHLQRSYPGAQW